MLSDGFDNRTTVREVRSFMPQVEFKKKFVKRLPAKELLSAVKQAMSPECRPLSGKPVIPIVSE